MSALARFRSFRLDRIDQMNQSRIQMRLKIKMQRPTVAAFFALAFVIGASLFSSVARAQTPPPPPPPTPPAAGESSSKTTDDAVPVPPKTDAEKDLAALPAMDRLAAVKDIEIGTYYRSEEHTSELQSLV